MEIKRFPGQLTMPSKQPEPDFAPAITVFLSLFAEDSKSVAMIRHTMDVIRNVVHHLNPHKVGSALFTIIKQIQ